MQKGKFSVLLFCIMILAIVACGGEGDTVESTPAATPTPTKVSMPTPTAAAATSADGEVINVVHSENPYRFQPEEFVFQVGKTYVIKTSPVTEFHTFTVEGLGIEIEVFPGDVAEFVFTPTAGQIGTFNLICIPHEGNGMVGTVTVK